MLKALLVDNEKASIMALETFLLETGSVEMIAEFFDSISVLKMIDEILPDVVFIDSQVPGMLIEEAVAQIKEKCPQATIVFTSANDTLAVKALELNVQDYLIKPFSKEHVEKAIEKLRQKEADSNIERKRPQRLKIKCLGRFQVNIDNQAPIKWRSEKTEELFAFLLQNRQNELTKFEILEAVWPEMEPDRATHMLHNAVYYIRKALSEYGVKKEQISINTGYALNLKDVEIDVDIFNRSCKEMSIFSNYLNGEIGVAIYQGEYMAGKGWGWAEYEREHLSRQFVQLVSELSNFYMKNREFSKAEALLLKSYETNRYDERITGLLLEVYEKDGRPVKAIFHYNRFCKELQEELGVVPGEIMRKKYAMLNT